MKKKKQKNKSQTVLIGGSKGGKVIQFIGSFITVDFDIGLRIDGSYALKHNGKVLGYYKMEFKK